MKCFQNSTNSNRIKSRNSIAKYGIRRRVTRERERERNLRSFFNDFLNVILAKASVASIVNLTNDGHRLGLANSYDSDMLRPTTGPFGGLLYSLKHGPERRRRGAVHSGTGGHVHTRIVLLQIVLYSESTKWGSIELSGVPVEKSRLEGNAAKRRRRKDSFLNPIAIRNSHIFHFS